MATRRNKHENEDELFEEVFFDVDNSEPEEEGTRLFQDEKPKSSSRSSRSSKTTKAEKPRETPEIQFKLVPEVKENKESFRYQLVPYIFSFLALFLLLCLLLEDKVGVVGRFTHMALLGLLSGGAYTIPFFIVYHAFMWHSDRKKNVAKRKMICSAVTIVLVSMAIHVFSGRENTLNPKILFLDGAESLGGGVLGGFLGSVLKECFGFAGALIVIFAVLFAMFLQMFDVTPRSIYISAAYHLKMRREDKAARKAAEKEASLRAGANVNVYRLSQKNGSGKALPGKTEAKAAKAETKKETGTAPAVPATTGGRKNPFDHRLTETEAAPATGKKANPLDSSLEYLTEEERKRKEAMGDVDFSFLDKIDNEFLARKPFTDTKPAEKPSAPIITPPPTPEEASTEIPLRTPRPLVTEDPRKEEKSAARMADLLNDASRTETEVHVEPVAPADEDIPPFDTTPAEPKPAPAPSEPRTTSTKVAPAAPTMPRGKIDIAKTEGEIDLRNLFEDPANADLIDKISNNEIQHSGEESLKLGMESEEEDFSVLTPVKSVKKPEPPPYLFPPIDLLHYAVSEKDAETVKAELQDNALKLVETLRNFNVKTKIIDVSRGPTITRYELAPEAGTRVRAIANLVDDIALNLATSGVRIEAPIPGKAAVGIEVPNKSVETVYIRSLLESPSFTEAKSKITVALGRDVAGAPIYFDISKMPHLLIAGATGMGKSVCINSLLISMLYKARPDEVKLILIDPKKVELSVYNGIPHLLIPVVNDPKKAAGALHWAVTEMDRRFGLIETVGVRDINGFNEIAKSDPDLTPLPRIVIIIDEFADLMMTAPDAVEESVCRLAQLARAAGMHLIIGTQRPSVNVITGLIKSNIPSRIAFTTSSQIDSRTIIDIAGAEKLIGRGDMLYAPVGVGKPIRVQGAFISDGEVEAVTNFLKAGGVQPEYNDEVIAQIEREAAKCVPDKDKKDTACSDGCDEAFDPMFRPALELAVTSGKISTSLIQRKLELGYGRAAKLIDRMEAMGYVGPANGSKPREVLITRQQYQEMVLRDDDAIS